jgi:flagellar basal body rod protein FlgB
VDVDSETAKFAESTVQVQAAFTFLNGQIKSILSALQG